MNRLAVFVEGHTEVVFIKKLIEEIAGSNRVQIENWVIRGGTNSRKLMQLKAGQPNSGQEYFVLIMDCGGDDQVKTRIIEEHENLTHKGYSKIIGIRDVRPDFTHSDIPKLEANLPKYIKTKLIPVEFILAIMELEAWYLAETSHFSKINPKISVKAIKEKLGFDPDKDNMELRLHPAKDLDNCYAIGGETYEKKNVKKTVTSLDYARMYLEFGEKFYYFGRLLKSLNDFFSP